MLSKRLCQIHFYFIKYFCYDFQIPLFSIFCYFTGRFTYIQIQYTSYELVTWLLFRNVSFVSFFLFFCFFFWFLGNVGFAVLVSVWNFLQLCNTLFGLWHIQKELKFNNWLSSQASVKWVIISKVIFQKFLQLNNHSIIFKEVVSGKYRKYF